MFKMKALAAVIMSTLLVDGAMAAEFAKEMSPVTVQLSNAAVEEKVKEPASSQLPRDLAKQWIRKHGMSLGSNENGVFIAVAWDVQDAKPRQMANARALGAMTAQLKAKSEIAKYLNANASAEVLYLCPSTTKMTEFDVAKKKLQDDLNDLMDEYKDAVASLDAEKANRIGDISMDELFKEGLTASLKECGIDFNIRGLEAKSRQRLAELKENVKLLEAQLEDIRKQAEELAGTLNNERKSETEILAEMIVSGAVVVNSWERYENGQYEIAVVVVWSPSQERFIRSVLGMDKEPIALKPTSGKSRAEYINGLDWHLVAGSRWFVDRDGNPHLFGIGMEELRDKKASTLERAEIMADSDAWSNLTMALQADVKFQQEAYRKSQDIATKDGGNETMDVSSAAREMKAAANLKLRGVSTVFDGVYPSPVTNRDVYVKVVHINPLSVRSALEKFNGQIGLAREVGKAQQQFKGYVNQSIANVEAARNDAESYAQGAAQSNATAVEQKSENFARETRHAAERNDVRKREGSFGGVGGDDFSF